MARLTIFSVLVSCLAAFVVAAQLARAQDIGTLSPMPLPPLENPSDPGTAASQLFGRVATPAVLKTRAIGFYGNGCLAGAEAMPIDGRTWQVMRPSRNRNWGHPELIRTLERLASQARGAGWNGLLIGDIAQPRGGPMLSGHLSHQVGLDADIWFTSMPDRVLSAREREEMLATSVVADDGMDVNPKIWSPAHVAILKAAATDPKVERVLINPAIKKALCRDVKGDRGWLRKMRPAFGHNYHFHVRIGCPKGDSSCEPQAPPPQDEGCGKELDWWFSKEARETGAASPEPISMSALPAECRQVLEAN
jgi:penicillin-insensitive murein endopeptidase